MIVPDAVAARSDFERTAGTLWARAGPDLALHLRLRRTGTPTLLRLARRLTDRARRAGGWCVVNRRVDVAMAAGAQGVQLGSGALPPREARRLLGPAVAVGVSGHAPGDVRRARRAGANLVVLGTIYPTPSHPDRPGAGLSRIAAGRDAGLPVVAIGGVTPERVPAVLGAGADGVAALRGVWGSESPEAAVARYLEALGKPADGEA